MERKEGLARGVAWVSAIVGLATAFLVASAAPADAVILCRKKKRIVVRDGPFCGQNETLLVLPVGPPGPEGPPGEPGADGAQGPPGDSVLPDAFKTFVAGPVAIEQPFTEVAAMDLPEGIYTATSNMEIIASNPSADPGRVNCELGLSFQGGGTASHSAFDLGRAANQVIRATFAMTVARGTTANQVRIGCTRVGTGDATANRISLVVIRVGTVTDL